MSFADRLMTVIHRHSRFVDGGASRVAVGSLRTPNAQRHWPLTRVCQIECRFGQVSFAEFSLFPVDVARIDKPGIPPSLVYSPEWRDPNMSARLLTVLILPTLLLNVALTPLHAAQQPPEPVRPPKTANSDKTQMVSKVYQVTDLVIPISNGQTGYSWALPNPIPNGWLITGSVKASPIHTENCMNAYKKFFEALGRPGSKEQLEDLLIGAIKTKVVPMIWDDAGGPASMEYFPLTHALVVNAPPHIHELIQDFLTTARKTFDQEVSVEVRFVSMSDTCWSRVQTELGLKDGKDGPIGSLNETALGKFLDRIQTDQCAHIMQAPKITMFNGQQATLRILESKTFVTGLNLSTSDENQFMIPKPVNEVVQVGMTADLGLTVSADRRFVQTDLSINNSRLESEDVELVPTVFVMKQEPGNKCRIDYMKVLPPVQSGQKPLKMSEEETERLKDKQAVIFTQFIQKPKIGVNRLETKLNLPDGKTAVLFGWKQTSEVIDEVRVLSKLPYIGKQYQHKRQVPETVLVLVTPRVIAPQEAEEVLPAPKPVQVQAAPKASGDGEESDLKTIERVWANEWQNAHPGEKNVDELLAKYHKLCAAGKKDAARKVALKALKIDPTCFDRK
jgi:hypothetical protein